MVAVLTEYILAQWSTRNVDAPAWLRKLRRFVAGIRRTILEQSDSWSFEAPHVRAGFKKREHGVCLFRALAQFGLRDGLISSCVAYYFRRNCDAVFDEASFAFRAPLSSAPATHHDAVQRLIEFRRRQSKNVWVAEVDIRGFFDVLGHDTVRRAVSRLEQRLAKRFDQRAKRLLWSYLRCYSFNLFAKKRALQHARTARHKLQCHAFDVPWPEAPLKDFGRATRTEPIGVPQGGALSCFIANAVLDFADDAVRQVAPVGRALYMRYCDDVVICAVGRTTCARMLAAYTEAANVLKLPTHAPSPFVGYYRVDAKAFWGAKSKKPYHWSIDDRAGCVPWCSFVGYQIGVDGTLRIRMDSMKKAFARHNNQVKKVATVIRMTRRRGGKTLSDRQVMYRTRQRLRSSSVGTTLLHLGNSRSAISWAGGFKLLREQANPALRGQLRSLDRHRGQVLKRLKRALAGAPQSVNPSPPKKNTGFIQFEGRPYSYAAIADAASAVDRG